MADNSIRQPSLPTPLLLADVPVRMAKTGLRNTEQDRVRVGKVVEQVRKLSGLNLQEFAKELGRNERQVYRWINGTERAQLELIVVSSLNRFLVIALAESEPSIAVKTTIEVPRRTA